VEELILLVAKEKYQWSTLTLARQFLKVLDLEQQPNEKQVSKFGTCEYERLIKGMFHLVPMKQGSLPSIPRLLSQVLCDIPDKTRAKMEIIDLYSQLGRNVKQQRLKAHVLADLARFVLQLSDDMNTANSYLEQALEIWPQDRTLYHIYGSLYSTKLQLYPPGTIEEIFQIAETGSNLFEKSRSLPLGARDDPGYPYFSDLKLYKLVLELVCDRSKCQTIADVQLEIRQHPYLQRMEDKLVDLLSGIPYSQGYTLRKSLLLLIGSSELLARRADEYRRTLKARDRQTQENRKAVMFLMLYLETQYHGPIDDTDRNLVVSTLFDMLNGYSEHDFAKSFELSRVTELQVLWNWAHYCGKDCLSFQQMENLLDKCKNMRLSTSMHALISYFQLASRLAYHCHSHKSLDALDVKTKLDEFCHIEHEWLTYNTEFLCASKNRNLCYLQCLVPVKNGDFNSIRDVSALKLLKGVVIYRNSSYGVLVWEGMNIRFPFQANKWVGNSEVEFCLQVSPRGLFAWPPAHSKIFNYGKAQQLKGIVTGFDVGFVKVWLPSIKRELRCPEHIADEHLMIDESVLVIFSQYGTKEPVVHQVTGIAQT